MKRIRRTVLLLCWLPSLHVLHAADLKLTPIFSDHMVLQRNQPIPILGSADPGAEISIEFSGQIKSAKADSQGKWIQMLDPLEATSSPLDLVVKTGDKSVRCTDVLVGDVWFCSGQSNMAALMAGLKKTKYAPDLASANFPTIRQGKVPPLASTTPVEGKPVKWEVCSPATVENFTATGYYFARELQAKLNIPIGIVLSAVGGTSVESWTDRAVSNTVPEFKARAEEQLKSLEKLPERLAQFPEALAEWEKTNGRGDAKNEGEGLGWADPAGTEADWKPGNFTKKLSENGLTHGGILWFRKELSLHIPSEPKVRMDLGAIEEVCLSIYFNGEKLADWGRKPPTFYNGYAYFDIPQRLFKEGRNVFAVRVVANSGTRPASKRGFKAIGFGASGWDATTDDCLVRIEKEYPPLAAEALKTLPQTPTGSLAGTSGALYEGMVRTVAPFAIKGVVWYQGEADGSRGLAYRRRLPLLIQSWRTLWGQGNFPFLVQQLPNWNAGGADAIGWAELREAQALTARVEPNVFMSVGIDLGEADNVHPANKRDVGTRLGWVAAANVYHQAVEFSGPTFDSMSVEGHAIRLNFKSSTPLQSVDGGALKEFSIAGEDHKFVSAEAKIEGNSVLVFSSGVSSPMAVRYAFKNNPEGCNLSNASGLPAAPFRTDIPETP
jgi:sialate O-acetylesterase